MKRKTIWNVSIVTTEEDNGHTVSFESVLEAFRCYNAFCNEGLFSVKLWRIP